MIDQPRKYDKLFYKQRVTCEINELPQQIRASRPGTGSHSLARFVAVKVIIALSHTPYFVRLFIFITSICRLLVCLITPVGRLCSLFCTGERSFS